MGRRREKNNFLSGPEQEAFNAVMRIGNYTIGYDDCSNNAYELWYWLQSMGFDCQILMVYTSALHAQVEGLNVIYDPTLKITVDKNKIFRGRLLTTEEWAPVNPKNKEERLPPPTRLPSNSTFGRTDFDYIPSLRNVRSWGEFQFPNINQKRAQYDYIIRHCKEAKRMINEERILSNGNRLSRYLQVG